MKKRLGFVLCLLLATLCFDAAFAQVGHTGLFVSLRQLLNLL
jgi:hypothetical protein